MAKAAKLWISWDADLPLCPHLSPKPGKVYASLTEKLGLEERTQCKEPAMSMLTTKNKHFLQLRGLSAEGQVQEATKIPLDKGFHHDLWVGHF